MQKVKINALVLGKSGVGKSSLMNYLWGEEKREAATGRPVTASKEGDIIGIYPLEPFDAAGHQIVVHDSYGLEADKAQHWVGLMNREIAKRERNDDPETWFHAVIYCLDAKKSRLDDFEIEHVLKPIISAGHRVTVVLTKSDIASPHELSALEDVVHSKVSSKIKIVRASSERKTLLSGKCVEPFGRDQLVDCLVENFSYAIKLKFDARYRNRFRQHCYQWAHMSLAYYDRESGYFTRTSPLLDRVKEKSDAYLCEELKAFDDWAERLQGKLSAISEAFNNVFDAQSRSHVHHHVQRTPTPISWGFAEKATDITMALIPILNIGYSFVRTSIHRDELEEKLNTAAGSMMAEFERRLEQSNARPARAG